jgi:hypothetical protein
MRCTRTNRLSWTLLLSAWAAHAGATDWEASLDLRLVGSNVDPSYIDGGVGATRFDRDDAVFQLGRARLALTQPIGELWSAHVDASMWDTREANPLGVTEGWLLFRPYPMDGYRLRLKSGAFYAPISLENRASGWESPYTLTYSAIDSWLAAEVRTIGSELQLEWLGTRSGHAFDVALTGAVFGWNDRAGVVLADTGFVMTDRQTPLGGRVGQPGDPPLKGAKPFMEIDGRAGLYGGIEARYLDRLVVRVLRYDNRADPSEIDYASRVIAWHTSFTSAGARLETASGWTGIVQWLDGNTVIAPPGFGADWPFHAAYILLARRIGPQMLSLRYDTFRVDADRQAESRQAGHAFTAACMLDLSAAWRLSLEWLLIDTDSYNRAEVEGLSSSATRSQVQLSVRYAIGSQIH